MAASIKCDERPFKGGVWRGFAPPAKNILTWRTLFTKTIDANKWHAAICISEIFHQSQPSSNGCKIARIAPISTIFGPIESQWHDLFVKKNRTNEPFSKSSSPSLPPSSSSVVFGEIQIAYCCYPLDAFLKQGMPTWLPRK